VTAADSAVIKAVCAGWEKRRAASDQRVAGGVWLAGLVGRVEKLTAKAQP
jgi:hypothetical protein